VLAGSHDITAPVVASQNLQLTVVPAGSTLNISSLSLSGDLVRLTKAGAGTAIVRGNNTYTGVTTVKGGRLVLGGPTAWGPALTGAAGSDIQRGRIVFDYTGGSSPASTIEGILDTGFDQTPKFSLGQIRTSNPEDASKGLGWIDNTAASQVVVGYTWYGDANLDGQVDITDLGLLATNWQTAGVWGTGDFDYSDFVDITDLGMLATNWQLGVGDPLRPSLSEALASVGLTGVAVPEPASIGLLAVGALALGTRRRR
jgi:autotransporter-associated beta strand protein